MGTKRDKDAHTLKLGGAMPGDIDLNQNGGMLLCGK
jgi:hypothetical protein